MELSSDHPLALAVTAAIHTGDTDELRNLLASHPGLAQATVFDHKRVRRTLLHIAADWPGHFPNGPITVAMLIDGGADPDVAAMIPGREAVAETPLHWAASSDDVAVLDALLDGGANIEAAGAVFTGGTPMSDAVVFAQWNAARRLLQRGARTTLWQSAALGLIDRVQESCAAEPPPTDRDVTNAFWNACRGGQRETAEYLLQRGADPHWIGHDHKTPMDVARESGSESLIEWLRAQGV